jgi:hypothetical protein
MPSCSFVALIVLFAADAPTPGDKVAAYCKKNKGEQVGNGECSALAGAALKDAGAKGRGKDDPNDGDYTWGKLVYRQEKTDSGFKSDGKRQDIKPGDVIQFRDTKWESKTPTGSSTMTFGHHTAVVAGVEEKGKVVKIYHQNYNGKKVVMDGTLRLDDLKAGWIRVYHPVAADE